MDIESFVKEVLVQIDRAVDTARTEANREITFVNDVNGQTIKFEIAVTAEEKVGGSAKAGLKVYSLAEVGAGTKVENNSATVSRVTFGLNISGLRKDEPASFRTF